MALRREFTTYGEGLERVEVFKYLGRMLTMDDVDGHTIGANLKKARRCWARLSRVLRAEYAAPRVCGIFYRATVQAVLLFGAETWDLLPADLRRLEGFHVRAAYRMSREHRPERTPNGRWQYPRTEAVLEEVGLKTVEEYVKVRRATIAQYVATRPVLDECRAGTRQRGSSPQQWWWEQPMGLEE